MQVKLWRKGPITGLWEYQRTCSKDEAAQWLAIFQRDEPGVTFKLSKVKPKTP
jgi:hypothetical protein